MKRVHTWLKQHVHSKHAPKIFSALIFIESFFLVPVTTLFSFYCLERPKHVFFFATIASIASFFGSIVGYSLGGLLHNLWDSVGERFVSSFMTKSAFDAQIELYKSYAGWQITMATLTPLPFKLITVSAGFCHVKLSSFLFYSFIGRTIKFFTIATAFHFLGEKVSFYIDRYFNYIVIGSFGLLLTLLLYTIGI